MTRPDDCGALRELLHERLDGTLDGSRSAQLERHLEVCFDCRAEAAELQSVRDQAARLPRQIEPTRDLWPGVERRLELPWWRRLSRVAGFGAGWWRPARALAGAAALVAVALGVWLWRAETAPPIEPASATATRLDDAAAIARRNQTRAELARFEDGMLRAHQDLLAAAQSQPERFSPETLATIEENMRIIDQAIGQIRTALEDDPLNPRLNLQLAAQYQHEVQLLKRLSGV